MKKVYNRARTKVDLNEFQRLAARTLPDNPLHGNADGVNTALLLHGALKLSGEAGEISDQVGKWYGQGHDLNVDHLVEELGDVLWHVAEIATALDYDLGEVAYRNLEKLHKRYPDGFDAAKSKRRGFEDV